MQRHRTGEAAARVLVEVLRLSRENGTLNLDEVASKARTSRAFAENSLSNTLRGTSDSHFSVTPLLRFRLAMEARKTASLTEIAKTLTWQEFEKFTEECLWEAGFNTERNVRVKGSQRSWQIDVVGSRGQLLLSFDCKNWKPPNSPSRFKNAIEHQREATRALLASMALKNSPRQLVWALPVILALHDPPASTSGGVILLSIRKLPDFLEKVSPYSEGLPFISSDETTVENSIKE